MFIQKQRPTDYIREKKLLWRILCYHAIDRVNVLQFKKQLKWFRSKKWEFCSLSDGFSLLNTGHDNHAEVATVSFDDGDHSVCDVAQPILDRMGIKGIIYLVPEFVVKGKVEQTKRKALDWQQLNLWLEAGHEIGSHTYTHQNLLLCSKRQIEDELCRSRESIYSNLGKYPVHFSYPWGQYSEFVVKIIDSLSEWQSAATIDRGWNQTGKVSQFLLKRDLVNPEWSIKKVWINFFLGNCGVLYRLQRKLRALQLCVHPIGNKK